MLLDYYEFHKIHRKILVPESLFNKVAGLWPAALRKKETPEQLFSCEFCEILRASILRNISARLLLFICSKQLPLEATVQMYSQKQLPRDVM